MMSGRTFIAGRYAAVERAPRSMKPLTRPAKDLVGRGPEGDFFLVLRGRIAV